MVGRQEHNVGKTPIQERGKWKTQWSLAHRNTKSCWIITGIARNPCPWSVNMSVPGSVL